VGLHHDNDGGDGLKLYDDQYRDDGAE